jgi:hypothetical protein
MATKTWTVQVALDETDDDTLANAVLRIENKMEIRGKGMSRRNPSDESEPRIGDELAAARALSDLAHQLLAAAANDIEAKTHVPVRSLQL